MRDEGGEIVIDINYTERRDGYRYRIAFLFPYVHGGGSYIVNES